MSSRRGSAGSAASCIAMFPPEPKLSRYEERLLSTLRDLPPGDVREAFVALVDDLTTFVLAPRCPEMQADGVPCESTEKQCDRCRHAASVLRRLRAEVPH